VCTRGKSERVGCLLQGHRTKAWGVWPRLQDTLRQETGVCTRGKSRTASGRARCGLQARAAAGSIWTYLLLPVHIPIELCCV